MGSETCARMEGRMKIAVNTEIELDDEDAERQIVAEAASQLIGSIHTRYDQVSKAIQAALEAKAEKIVDEFFAAGIQPVDGSGDPKGPRLPVKEFLAAAAKTWMDTAVNDRGEPTRESYGTKMTRGEWLIKKHAIEGIAGLASAEVKNIREAAKAAIKATVAATVEAVLLKG